MMATKLDLVSVVGARPQFVKLGPVSRAFDRQDEISHRVIHTGQHYDDKMSAVFFDELDLPRPDIDLGVGSAGHGEQTAQMLSKLEKCFLETRPDAILVYGDTNSTLAATLAGVKIHVPVAHIEAGLRSFNRQMPEEINRLVSDHCGDRLYAPTPAAMQNLIDENLVDRAVLSGDVMRDAVLHNRQKALAQSRVLDQLDLTPGRYGLLTIHRPANTNAEALHLILGALEKTAAASLPLIFPVHPRTQPLVNQLGYKNSSALIVVEPVSYLDMLRLLDSAAIVVTDSGGLQKEAAFLETPCLTLRQETEWVETVALGINQLVGQNSMDIQRAFDSVVDRRDLFGENVREQLDKHYGNGSAAQFIVNDLVDWLGCQNVQ